MIVVSADGAKAMGYSADFASWAREHGIRDPFKVSRDLFSKRCRRNADGSTSIDIEWDEKTGKIKDDPEEPTRAERNNYIAMRDEYVARRCFYEIGYNSFLFHTKPHDYECEYDISHLCTEDEFVPCRSADGQCSLFCHRYIDCALNHAWAPEDSYGCL